MFVIVQRSVALIGLLLLNIDYGRFSLGSNYSQLHVLNIITYVLAVFLGGWYGAWLGLYWYKIVYEQGTGGLWHGLVGNFFYDTPEKKQKKSLTSIPSAQPKVEVRPRGVDSVAATKSWEFDDLLSRKLGRQTSVTQSRPRIATKDIEPQNDTESEFKTVARRVKKVGSTKTTKRSTGTAVKRRATSSTRSRATPIKEIVTS